VYTINDRNELIPLVETRYARELDLQDAVADHPELLAGDQMNPIDPRRFVLVTSEAGLANSTTSGNVFSLDLLFVDQDGIPTLVEVKRSTDTRLRREVIAQLLEYAATFVAFWNAPQVQSAYESSCSKRSQDPREHLYERLGVVAASDYEAFWQMVRTNLDQQRLRLVIVADTISLDTLRIVEYLNRQMPLTDVFAIAIPQYAGGTTRAIAPRVLNPSILEVDKKEAATGQRRGEQWTKERFFADLQQRAGADPVRLFSEIEAWATQHPQVGVSYGYGKSEGSIIFSSSARADSSYRPGDLVFLTLWSYGSVEVEFQYLAARSPFSENGLREELRQRLNQIPPISIPLEKIDKRPNIRWNALVEPSVKKAFLVVQECVIDRIVSEASQPGETADG